MNPAQGVQPWPSVESYFHRGAGGGLTIYYTGAANQTAHTTGALTFDNIFAYPLVLDGGVIDTVEFEVTTGVANAVGRCGLYTNTSEQIIYPNALVVDGGEKDCSTNGVKATSSLSVAIPPGLYWLVTHAGVATPTIRTIAPGGVSHILGLLTTMGASPPLLIAGARAYSALPLTFPASIAMSAGTSARMGAVHFAS